MALLFSRIFWSSFVVWLFSSSFSYLFRVCGSVKSCVANSAFKKGGRKFNGDFLDLLNIYLYYCTIFEKNYL